MRCVLRLQAAGLVALACAIFGSAGCSSMKVDTHTVDPTFAFGKIHTWAWTNPPTAPNTTEAATHPASASSQPGPIADSPAGVQAVRESIEEALARKGFVKAPPGTQPDFLVAARAILARRYAIEPGGGGGGGGDAGPMYTGPNAASDSGYRISPAVDTSGSDRGGGGHGGTSREFDHGELVLEIIDPVTHTSVWRGEADDRINTRADLEHKEGLIDKAVNKMLADFPRKSKQS